MKLLAVLLLVAAGFGAAAETLSIPAGGSMTVTDADWATFSAYTEVSVAAADGETPAGGYPVLTVTDGVLSGTPDLVAAPLPENWAYRQRGNSIRLCFLKGTLLLVK